MRHQRESNYGCQAEFYGGRATARCSGTRACPLLALLTPMTLKENGPLRYTLLMVGCVMGGVPVHPCALAPARRHPSTMTV